jgi:hypothetical protein|tara:strand:+ start:2525 stop:2785 length:261 start_codon:yes stop_codon:yes gene_type:complete
MMKAVNRNKKATLVLMTAMFLNPMGYDALFYMVLKMTNDSYAITTFIFYLLSVFLFGLYFYLIKINPFRYILTVLKYKRRKFVRKK